MIIFPLAQPASSVQIPRGTYTNLNLYNYVTGTRRIDISQSTDIIITISSAAIIASQWANSPAIIVGDWPPSINLSIVNNGFISGRGGNGGLGGIRNGNEVPTAGGNGTAGIFCTVPCSITNNGTIQGGGGGGGGGSYSITGNGGGGGGGIGLGFGGEGFSSGLDAGLAVPGSGGEPTSGVVPLPGAGGNGGRWLESDGTTLSDGIGKTGGGSAVPGAAGGQPGKAIDFNGNTVNVTDNGTIFGEES